MFNSRRIQSHDRAGAVNDAFLFGRLSLARILTGLALLFAFQGLAWGANISVREEFQNDDYAHDKWRIEKFDPKDMTVDVTEGSLHIVAPPGPKGRAPFRIVSKFGVDGDFEATMDFNVNDLPKPEEEFVTAEIILSGKGGMAHFSRVNHAGAGHGFIVYFAPPKESGKKSIWKHEAGEYSKGTLRVKRVGGELIFSVLPDGDTDYVDIVRADYGPHHIDRVTYSVNVAGTVDVPVDIRLDNLEVKNLTPQEVAVEKEAQTPRSMLGPASWIAFGLIVVLAAGVGFFLWKSKGLS